MNCIEKMYKEIEEILQKEKNEASHMQVSFKEIKYSFDDKTEKEQEGRCISRKGKNYG